MFDVGFGCNFINFGFKLFDVDFGLDLTIDFKIDFDFRLEVTIGVFPFVYEQINSKTSLYKGR